MPLWLTPERLHGWAMPTLLVLLAGLALVSGVLLWQRGLLLRSLARQRGARTGAAAVRGLLAGDRVAQALDAAVDRLNRRYGQHAVTPAALLDRSLKPYHSRDAAPERYDTLLHGETARHLAIPRMSLSNPV